MEILVQLWRKPVYTETWNYMTLWQQYLSFLWWNLQDVVGKQILVTSGLIKLIFHLFEVEKFLKQSNQFLKY